MSTWLALLAFALDAGAPDGLLEMPDLGAARSALAAESFECAAQAGTERCRLDAAGGILFAGVPAREVVFDYRSGRLVRISLTVDEARRDELEQQMTDRLGAGEEHVEMLRAGMGGLFPNRMLAWRDDGAALLLEHYFERVTRSAVMLMREDELSRFLAEREAQRKRGIRDL